MWKNYVQYAFQGLPRPLNVTSMVFQGFGRPWNTIPCCWLVMTKESSPMMMTHTGNASSLRWQEVGRRQGAEEVVVIWAYSVALVCLLGFVSNRFVIEIIKWLDYRSNLAESLIIKCFDNQAQLSVWWSKVLIIKSKNPTIKSIRVGKTLDIFPCFWAAIKTHKQIIVTLSSCETEYISLCSEIPRAVR